MMRVHKCLVYWAHARVKCARIGLLAIMKCAVVVFFYGQHISSSFVGDAPRLMANKIGEDDGRNERFIFRKIIHNKITIYILRCIEVSERAQGGTT